MHNTIFILHILEMYSVSTNGERASPAQQGFQLIGCNFLISMTIILVKYLPMYISRTGSYQCSEMYTYIGWLLAHKLLVVRYFSFITCVNSYMLMPYL